MPVSIRKALEIPVLAGTRLLAILRKPTSPGSSSCLVLPPTILSSRSRSSTSSTRLACSFGTHLRTGESRPFALTWTMDDLARWLHEIFATEGIARPILVGQSMGGYTAQVFMELFPGEAAGFVSIDSCSLQRRYYTWWELAALRHTKLMYLSFPWKTLVRLGSSGNTTTHYGSKLMESMMLDYQKREYCELAAHGFRVLADAVSADRPYQIDCPYVLICGEEDRAGSAKRYNRAWEAQEGTPIHWIENAGHNSNCDNPAEVNAVIEGLMDSLG